MPSKKYLQLQDFSDQDLATELADTEVQFQKLRFDHTIKGLIILCACAKSVVMSPVSRPKCVVVN